MRIRVFTPNKDGKIELTKEELENLLNEAYRQGWNDRPYTYGGFTYGLSTLCADTASTAKKANIVANNSATSTPAGFTMEL